MIFNLSELYITNIKFIIFKKKQAGVNIRPFAIESLTELSKDFEIVLFTASHSCYASKVIEYLEK